MYEILDATAILRAWSHLRRPVGPVVGPWLRGDRALFWFRDPMPALGGIGQSVGRRVERVLERIRGTGAPRDVDPEPSNSAVSAR
jgi:hypothetical protein